MSPVQSEHLFRLRVERRQGRGGVYQGQYGIRAAARRRDPWPLRWCARPGIIRRLEGAPHDTWACPENQCLRPLSGEFGLASFNGCLIEANLPRKAKLFRNPLAADYGSVDKTKLSGGRSAVQDTSLAEVFYLPDPHEGVRIESGKSALKVEGDGITVTAFKLLEDASGLLVRVCNFSSKARDAKLSIQGVIYNSRMDETQGEQLGENELAFCMNPKEVRSFIIR